MKQQVDQILKQAIALNASDIHLACGVAPKVRIYGDLEKLNEDVLTADELEQMLAAICPPHGWARFEEQQDYDFSYVSGKERFRVNYFRNFWGVGAVFRHIPSRIQSIDELLLPSVLMKVAEYRSGLVLVTGPTGSGKSTTLAAMIDHINKYYRKKIITIEDPVEFVHESKKSVIQHREIGTNTKSFKDAVHGVVRADSDVVLIGEMRDLETMKQALTCAAMGMLVFATLHTNNATETVDRIVDSFPGEDKNQIRVMLAESLKAVISQVLCKRVDGSRILANEILLYQDSLPFIIRTGQNKNIRLLIDSCRDKGMIDLDSSLKSLVDRKQISTSEAYLRASDKQSMINHFKLRNLSF